MRILQVHNYYQQSGGEDTVVKNEYELLKFKGHEVFQLSKYNDSIKGFWNKLKVLLFTHYSKKSYKFFWKKLIQIKPDIVHVHNFFPLFTPSIFDACKHMNIPIVLTLHNFRIFHPNGLLLHKGMIDLRGVNSSAYRCISDRVYRNSMIQTAVVAHMIEYHKKRNTWNTKISKIIVLSKLSKEIFISGGINAKKIVIKSNFSEDFFQTVKIDKLLINEGYFIYVGRISEEKGIRQLINFYQNDDSLNELKIIGDGPLKDELLLKTQYNHNIEWLGELDHQKVLYFIRNARALIFPSICYENFPMTIVEALSMNVPVLASNIGAAKYIITQKKEGVLYNPHNSEDFYKGIDEFLDQKLYESMCENARNLYLEKFTPEINYEILVKIYNEAISSNN